MKNITTVKPEPVNGINERIADLSPAKLANPELRLGEKSPDISREQAIPRRADRDSAPLSFAQQRLWFLGQLGPNRALYNIPKALRICGDLNVAALQKSLGDIVARHESLRTTFVLVNGTPKQVIAKSRSVELPVIDLSDWPEAESKAEVHRLLKKFAQFPFNLTHDLLLRATLVCLGKQEWVLLLVMHHIASDGESTEVLLRDLAAFYTSSITGRPLSIPPLPIQFADFAHWQRQRLRGEILEEQLSYWKKQLWGSPPVLELPTDRPRLAMRTFRGATRSLTLPSSLLESLKALSRQEGVTLFITLLAAFQTMLHRYTGRDDITVGSPGSGRTRVETESLIGCFVNNLALRGDLSGNPTFRELLGRIRQVVLGAYAHQELPFAKLLEELQPEDDTSSSPLFQVMLHLRDVPQGGVELPDLKVDHLEFDSGIAEFDLTLEMVEEAKGLSCLVKYNADLFDTSTVARMSGHFQALLGGIAVDPGQRLSELPLLTEGEQRQMLVVWNATKVDYPPDQCLHQLFEAQAERDPNAIAVAFEDHQLTYGDLNRRANQLACYLRNLGVGPEVLVGLCVERSLEMVIGLLGILKAGGAYVPLDPEYPKERLAFMVEDAKVPVLLTQERLIKGLPEYGGRVLCLDSCWHSIAREEDENPGSGVTPNNLAYVIYTSGSTGKPKGAMNTHRGICNRLLWMQEAYQLTPADRVLQKTPFSFDVSVWEFFWPLLTGARLVLARPGGHRDGAYLVQLIAEEQITTLHFVPSMLQVFLKERGLETCSCLRQVMCSGEALPLELQDRFFAQLGAELHNLYGPTEAAVDVTFWACERETNRRTVPIGRPIANTQMYVLDSHLRPVPIGVPGELHIGGVGLARGYLSRPELTAEKFIPNPFGSEAGARLYKTGDLACYLSDGTIEYLGRIDHQVKIRGFRIELGEVELVLGQHPAVREAVVLAREDVPGEKRLVAYLVADRQTAPSIAELRSFLKEKLPEYMVPSTFMFLDAFPLSPNGKLDRRALPSPGQARPELERACVAPRTELERLLAAMWRETLGIQKVGIHDDFFELGGDSIQGAVFINKLQKELGETIYVVALFNAPNIADLAVYLSEHYPEAVSRMCGIETCHSTEPKRGQAEKVDSLRVTQMRQWIRPLPPRGESGGARAPKNPPAVFILSPPRSGSTLLRIMLAGHPRLFAPQELELLCFNTLEERRATFSGRYSFWLEGLVRAVMEIKGCDANEAKRVMEDHENQKLTTQQFYRLMQEWIGEKRLVDKTPSYALDLEVLKRAETDFDNALYIHLLRHPYGMIRSFEEAKSDQIFDQVFFRHEHPFSGRELAELVWLISHQNILEFLKSVPGARQHRVKFEDVVKQPRPVLEGICQFLGLEFHADMLQPYKEKEKRMTDGLHAVSKMLGDVKFHGHKDVDAGVADRWKGYYVNDFLGDVTWQTAESLGYEKLTTPSRNALKQPVWSSLVAVQAGGSKRPFFCVPGNLTNVFHELRHLAQHLGPDQPFYGFQDGIGNPTQIKAVAARYISEVRAVQPEGPYLLGGVCLGGVVAFEMAQQLRARGQQVALLALIEPMRPSPSSLRSYFDMAAWVCRRAVRRFGHHKKKFSRSSSADQQAYVRLRSKVVANRWAWVRYKPLAYADRITLLMASESLSRPPQESGLGWRELAAGGVDLHVIPGNPDTITGNNYVKREEAQLKLVAEQLRACIDGVQVTLG